MATFSTPFTTPANYTYDNTKIEVIGGLAVLKEDLTNVYARWHMNESSGNNVPDDSGNGRDGTRVLSPTWVAGHLNNCLNFNGINQYVDCGSIAGFEYTNSFSVEAWIKTPLTTRAIAGKALRSGTYRGWLFWLDASGYLEGYLINSVVGGNWIQVRGSTAGLNDNAWHHVVMTYDGSGVAAGMKLYVDGALETPTPVQDTLSSNTIVNAVNMNIGSLDNGSDAAVMWSGRIDETAVYDDVLILLEVQYRNNSGAGREYWYYTDEPIIYKTAGDTDTLSVWSSFSVTEGTVEGSLRYQLSIDGVSWLYWDGGAWSAAGLTDYNTKATVNTNIGTFPTAPDTIYVKTFLISDGDQEVEIDNIDINYLINQSPLVNAGTNKTAKDGQTIQSFSDCTFSDPDGTVDHVYYKVDGEVDVWTEILQGGYATLLEAVQDFDYTFDNLGVLTVRLQVEDNLATTSEDSLTVTVTNYTRTVIVRHSLTNEDIVAVDFNPGDGSGFALQNSPFSYSWDYGSVDLTMRAEGFYSKIQTVLMEDESDLNLVMSPVSVINENKASVGLITDSDTLVITPWLLKSGEIHTSPISCVIDFKDKDGITVFSDSSVSHTDGVFLFEQTPSGLLDEGVYRLEVIIIADGTAYVTVIPVDKISRDKFSLDDKVYIDTVNGVTGTVYPKGTFNKPVDNWADARVIADANLIKRFIIRGNLIFTSGDDISGYEFSGNTIADVLVTLQGGVSEKTIFKNVEISGQVNGHIHLMNHCSVKNMTDFEGEIHECGLDFSNFVLVSDSSKTVMIAHCWSEVPGSDTPIIDMGGDGPALNFRAYSGGIKLINKTGSSNVTLEFVAGQWKLANTVTDGYITIRGVTKKGQDDSGIGCIVDTNAAVMNPWAASVAENLSADSFGELMNLLRAEAAGRMDVDFAANTLTLYDLDNTTILRVFDLTATTRTLPSYIGRTPR